MALLGRGGNTPGRILSQVDTEYSDADPYTLNITDPGNRLWHCVSIG
jgi:hypothetical protein